MSQFLMPSLGADMESAILMEWLVKEGDSVTKGQVIAEVETSKGVIEIEVFEDGVVEKLLVEEETECAVGMPLALICSNKEETKEPEVIEEKSLQDEAEKELIRQEESINQEEPVVQNEPLMQERIKISPAARRRADELGIELTMITPRDGVIQLSQVEAVRTKVLPKPKEQPKVDTIKSPSKLESKDGMRQAIAAAMSRSNAEIPHYYLSTPINMTPALTYLDTINQERSIQERILPVALLLRAVVLALTEVPQLNGFWREDEHQVSPEIHLGMAIALRKGGLMTPALLNAQELNLSEMMSAMSDLIIRTRKGKLRASEMTQQTITITNLGDLGVERVYGLIYPPQLAVVGLGVIEERPWVEGDALCIRKVMTATLAGDHRATDGRTGAKFLDKLNQYLQKPKELL